MRLLICGGRYFADSDQAWSALDLLHEIHGISAVIEGGARGADRIGAQWALQRDIKVSTYPADWNRYGRRAGHIRNGIMLTCGRPDLVVAFPGGTGTANMMAQAQSAGVIVLQPPISAERRRGGPPPLP